MSEQYLSEETLKRLRSISIIDAPPTPLHAVCWKLFGTPSPVRRIKNAVLFVLCDVQYSTKVVDCVLSGYRGLEWRTGCGEWEPVEDDEFPDNPYYVCAAFENGRHIPLPLVIGEESEYPFQNAVLCWIANHCDSRGLLRAFYQALTDCAYYDHDFDENHDTQ